MKSVTIGEFKAKLPDLLEEVAKGESILLQKGRRRENVAILAPCPPADAKPRRLGPLADRGEPAFKNWELDGHGFLKSQ